MKEMREHLGSWEASIIPSIFELILIPLRPARSLGGMVPGETEDPL